MQATWGQSTTSQSEKAEGHGKTWKDTFGTGCKSMTCPGYTSHRDVESRTSERVRDEGVWYTQKLQKSETSEMFSTHILLFPRPCLIFSLRIFICYQLLIYKLYISRASSSSIQQYGIHGSPEGCGRFSQKAKAMPWGSACNSLTLKTGRLNLWKLLGVGWWIKLGKWVQAGGVCSGKYVPLVDVFTPKAISNMNTPVAWLIMDDDGCSSKKQFETSWNQSFEIASWWNMLGNEWNMFIFLQIVSFAIELVSECFRSMFIILVLWNTHQDSRWCSVASYTKYIGMTS